VKPKKHITDLADAMTTIRNDDSLNDLQHGFICGAISTMGELYCISRHNNWSKEDFENKMSELVDTCLTSPVWGESIED
jgi:hypothetical protein